MFFTAGKAVLISTSRFNFIIPRAPLHTPEFSMSILDSLGGMKSIRVSYLLLTLLVEVATFQPRAEL
jgi:hypothetical protein